MIKVTLWLTNETKSHFSDLMGQDMKQKEVKTWNWCVSAWERLPYVKGNIWNRWRPGKGCEGWVRSPGSPRKGWDCVGTTVRWATRVCWCCEPQLMSWSLLDGSSSHSLRGFFWRLLCKTGYGSYQFFSEVLFENSDGKLFNMFTFLCICSLYKMFERKDQYLETT